MFCVCALSFVFAENPDASFTGIKTVKRNSFGQNLLSIKNNQKNYGQH